MVDGFKEAFEIFIKEWDSVSKEMFEKSFENLTYHPIETKINRKWAKVSREGSVLAFVNTENGEIMKPASWRAPAKHARGNIFSDKKGMEAVQISSICHIRYLKG